MEVERAPSQGTVFVEELEGGAFGPGDVVGVRRQDCRRVVSGDGDEQAGRLSA